MTNPTIDPISYNAGIEAAASIHDEQIDRLVVELGGSACTGPYAAAVKAAVNQHTQMAAAIRSLQRTEPQTVCKEFTNELGNRIKITIEGPTSISETILTPLEFRELQAAITLRTPVGKLYAETVHVRCHSAASPCNHQKSFPGTVCQACYDATTADAARRALADRYTPTAEEMALFKNLPPSLGDILTIAEMVERLEKRGKELNAEGTTPNGQLMLKAAFYIASLRAGGWREDMQS